MLSFIVSIITAVFLGMSIYLFYGLRHSVEGERQRDERHTNTWDGKRSRHRLAEEFQSWQQEGILRLGKRVTMTKLTYYTAVFWSKKTPHFKRHDKHARQAWELLKEVYFDNGEVKHDVYGKRQKWDFCRLSYAVCTVEWNYLYLRWIVGDIIPFSCALFAD